MNTIYKIPPSLYTKINSIYLSGKNTYEIAKDMGVSNVTISRILGKCGTRTRGRSLYDYNSSVFNSVLNFYDKGMSIKEISHNTRLPSYAILKHLHIKGSVIRNDNRKYHLNNDTLFNEIDTHVKAYFLGILFADGCNTSNKITLTLQKRDSYILDILSKLIYIDERPIYHNNIKLTNGSDAQYDTLCISNITIATSLLKHGMVPKKSLILEYPPYLFDNFFPSFLLGYFDGDGCVRIKKGRNVNSHKRTTFSIVGANNFLMVISEKLRHIIGVRGTISIYNCGKSTVKELRVATQNDVDLIYHAMYDNAMVFLKRKKDKFIINN